MSNILEILEDFAQSVPGLLSCSLVHRQDGTNIGSVNLGTSFEGDAADAYFAEMIARHRVALDALGLADQTEDILITTESAFFLARMLKETEYFLNVITTRQGNIGLTRVMMRKLEEKLIDHIP